MSTVDSIFYLAIFISVFLETAYINYANYKYIYIICLYIHMNVIILGSMLISKVFVFSAMCVLYFFFSADEAIPMFCNC